MPRHALRLLVLVGLAATLSCVDEKAAAERVAGDMNPILSELRPQVKRIRDAQKTPSVDTAKQISETCIGMRSTLGKLGRLEYGKKASVENQATTVRNQANILADAVEKACGHGTIEPGVGAIDCSTRCTENLDELEKRIGGVRKLTSKSGVTLDEL